MIWGGVTLGHCSSWMLDKSTLTVATYDRSLVSYDTRRDAGVHPQGLHSALLLQEGCPQDGDLPQASQMPAD